MGKAGRASGRTYAALRLGSSGHHNLQLSERRDRSLLRRFARDALPVIVRLELLQGRTDMGAEGRGSQL